MLRCPYIDEQCRAEWLPLPCVDSARFRLLNVQNIYKIVNIRAFGGRVSLPLY